MAGGIGGRIDADRHTDSVFCATVVAHMAMVSGHRSVMDCSYCTHGIGGSRAVPASDCVLPEGFHDMWSSWYAKIAPPCDDKIEAFLWDSRRLIGQLPSLSEDG